MNFIANLSLFLGSILMTVTPFFARAEQFGVTNIYEHKDKIHLQINSIFYFGSDVISDDLFSKYVLQKNHWSFVYESTQRAARCLTKAINSSGFLSKPVVVEIPIKKIRLMTPNEDERWSASHYNQEEIPICPQTYRASSASSTLRMFISHRNTPVTGQKGNFALPESYRKFELVGPTWQLERDHYTAIMSYRMGRDIRLIPPDYWNEENGLILAHEIAHAWGGLLDRYSKNMLETDRYEPGNCDRGFEDNLMCMPSFYDEEKSCHFTKSQVETIFRHFKGGRSEFNFGEASYIVTADPKTCEFEDID
jgi:hypothetical protein